MLRIRSKKSMPTKSAARRARQVELVDLQLVGKRE